MTVIVDLLCKTSVDKMAPCMASSESCVPNLKEHFLYQSFNNLNNFALNKGLCLHELRRISYFRKKKLSTYKKCWCSYLRLASGYSQIVIVLLCLFLLLCFKLPFIDGMMKHAFGIKCILPNNYVVWEATRPIANCNICSKLKNVWILPNVTREEFSKFAYSNQPIIVKNAARHWPAMKNFDYYYFKNLLLETEGSFESVEEECQFLNFKSDFKNLEEVFRMSHARVNHEPGTKPWYIGW